MTSSSLPPHAAAALVAQLLVSTTALASVLLAGRRDPATRLPRFPRAPWLLLVGAHAVMLAYVVATGQWGLAPLSAGMITAGWLNLLAARPRPATAPTSTSSAARASASSPPPSGLELAP